MDDTTDLDIDKMPIDNDPEKIDPKKCREVCWDLKERGAVGETILHLCLLNATSIHADLAKRLLRFYPKLINDIYMCDEYYGESVLHLAIVNEDPAMVKFLLDSGADYHERCTGNFMCPEDQKATRQDTVEHEWVNVAPLTNYEGYVYWGEYPLSFAACLGQEECYRLMLARGANPDNQDTNGNTVLHMLVIYEKLETFDMAYEVGANISVRNVQNLTPLTLAAKLARIEMFFHILNIEREIYWQIGSITCAAYPLSQIDTIDIETGQISKNSALNLVVFGDKDEHLELMDGVLVDLLNAKWNAFVKLRFYRQFFQFLLYFLVSLICFTLRPGPPPNLGQQAPAPGNPPVNITTFTKENNTIPQLVAALKAMVPDSQSYKRRKRQIPNSSDFAKEPVASRVNYIITYNNSENRVSEDVKGGKMDGKKGLSETNLTNVNSTSDSSSAKLIDNKLIFLRNVVASFQNDSLTQQNTSSHGKIDEMVDTNSNKYSSQSIFDSIQDKGIRGSRRDQNTTTLNTSSMDKFKTYLSRNSTNSNDSVSFSPTNKSDERELKNHNLDNCTAQAICFKQSAQANEDFLGVGKPANDRKTERQVEKTESKHDEDDDEEWWEDIQECRLLRIRNYEDVIRLSAEVALEIGALLYLLAAMREASFLGLHMFIENLMTVPSRVMFLFSCLLMMGAPLLRFSCEDEMEDIVAVIIMLTTSPYFLFFCRGFKTVGPFVVMIYRMVMGDLLRFVSIYVVFVMGFSQAYYIIFLSFDNPVTPDGVDDSISNPMPHPMEAAMAMFLMSLTTFGDYFSAFEKTEHEIEAKISVRTEYPTQLSETALKIIFQFFSWLREHSFSAFINITTKKRQSLWTSIGGQYKVCFVVYMGIVAILLVNMLIAMMGNTYQKIAETRNEWQRQWARIVLVVERGVSPSERLTKLMWYSQPMSDGRRALVLRLHQSEQDKEEMKEILEMKRVHNKIVEKRLKRLNRLSNNPSPSKPLVELPNLSNCGSPTKPLIDLTTNLNKL